MVALSELSNDIGILIDALHAHQASRDELVALGMKDIIRTMQVLEEPC